MPSPNLAKHQRKTPPRNPKQHLTHGPPFMMTNQNEAEKACLPATIGAELMFKFRHRLAVRVQQSGFGKIADGKAGHEDSIEAIKGLPMRLPEIQRLKRGSNRPIAGSRKIDARKAAFAVVPDAPKLWEADMPLLHPPGVEGRRDVPMAKTAIALEESPRRPSRSSMAGSSRSWQPDTSGQDRREVRSGAPSSPEAQSHRRLL